MRRTNNQVRIGQVKTEIGRMSASVDVAISGLIESADGVTEEELEDLRDMSEGLRKNLVALEERVNTIISNEWWKSRNS